MSSTEALEATPRSAPSAQAATDTLLGPHIGNHISVLLRPVSDHTAVIPIS